MNLKFSNCIFGLFFLLTSSQIFAATEKFNLQTKNPEKSEIIKNISSSPTSIKSLNTSDKIIVGTIERPPMAFKNLTGEWTGFSIDLLKEISEKAGFQYKLKPFDVFGDMVDSTKKAEVDFSIANISITAGREKEMDYSQPIIDSGLQVIISKNGNKKSFFALILESGILWFILGALGLLLFIAHLIWFFERGTSPDRHDYFRDDYLGGVWDAFWWAFIIMTMGGFENEVPASKFSRFLAMMWIVVSLFFVSSLTAQITSTMTVAGLSSSINSYRDLENKRIGVMKSDAVIKFCREEIRTEPIVFKKYEDFYAALKDKKVDALIGDAPVVNYYVSHNRNSGFKSVGEIFKPEKYGILYPENSKLKEQIDQVLLKMQEDGSYQKIYKKYFH